MNHFLAELKRRNVIRVAGLYLAGAWLLVQVAGTVLPFFNAPLALARTLTIVLAVGFIPVLALAWVFEWTAKGLVRESRRLRTPCAIRNLSSGWRRRMRLQR